MMFGSLRERERERERQSSEQNQHEREHNSFGMAMLMQLCDLCVHLHLDEGLLALLCGYPVLRLHLTNYFPSLGFNVREESMRFARSECIFMFCSQDMFRINR